MDQLDAVRPDAGRAAMTEVGSITTSMTALRSMSGDPGGRRWGSGGGGRDQPDQNTSKATELRSLAGEVFFFGSEYAIFLGGGGAKKTAWCAGLALE